jgi:fructokinase
MMYKRHLVTIDLVCFGELLWDIYEDEEKEEEKIGGAPFNVAALASLKGIRTLMITAVGNDDKGERLRAAASKKVRLHCQTNEHETGTVKVTLNEEGIPSFSIADKVAYDYITFNDTMARVCSAASLFCFGTLAQRHSTSRETLKRILGKTKAVKIYDFNYREGIGDWESIFAESVKVADILKVNEQELRRLKPLYESEEPDDIFVKRLMQCHNLRYVFVTEGEKGASLYSNATVLHRPASKCHVVDTTGCGDAFTAGIVYSLIKKLDECRMLNYAIELAGRVAEVKGAVPEDAGILQGS